MPYQIKCDGYTIYDPRDENLVVKSPRCKLAANTVGEASFTIHSRHPHYEVLSKLRSVFEIKQDKDVIFRGRMTDDSKDFYNSKQVDLEGAMAFFNDSMVRPFTFPDDFLNNAEYIVAANESKEQAAIDGGVVRFFLKWVIDNHNSQVNTFQRFKLGRVTVHDKNNYIARSETEYKKSWEILKEKLFESSLGGYLCIRYEADGNYIDFLSAFESDNDQKIVFGENLLDLLVESDATETYTAIIPLGADIEGADGTTKKLTISELADGSPSDDIIKKGDTLFIDSAVERFGWIYAPVSETTWEDVTTKEELLENGVDFLKNKAARFWETVTAKAVDLHLSNKEIEAFRIYKNVYVESLPHGQVRKDALSELDIDIENPQNTQITVGERKRVLTDKTNEAIQRAETAKNTVKDAATKITVDLSNKVDKTDNDQVVAMVNKSTKPIVIIGDSLDVEDYKFGLAEDGTIIAKAGEIGGCLIKDGKLEIPAANITEKLTAEQINADNISASGVNITGHITAKSGNIGKWSVENESDLKGVYTSSARGYIYQQTVHLSPFGIRVIATENGTQSYDKEASWHEIIAALNLN